MRFALNAPNFGPYADVAAMVELARVAERSGWDGLFIWDHVTWQRSQPQPLADPWVLLTAIALATSRLRLGTMGHARCPPAPHQARARDHHPRPRLKRPAHARRRSAHDRIDVRALATLTP